MSLREALVEAGLAALVAEGPAFALERVAREAGASKALLFHHFGTREGLLDAMAARVLAQTQEGLARLAEEHANPRDRLDALVRALLADPAEPAAATRRVLQFWLLDDGEGLPRARHRDALLEAFIRDTVREGARLGLMRDLDVAELVLARWHGLTVLHATGRGVAFDLEAERLVAEVSALVARA